MYMPSTFMLPSPTVTILCTFQSVSIPFPKPPRFYYLFPKLYWMGLPQQLTRKVNRTFFDSIEMRVFIHLNTSPGNHYESLAIRGNINRPHVWVNTTPIFVRGWGTDFWKWNVWYMLNFSFKFEHFHCTFIFPSFSKSYRPWNICLSLLLRKGIIWFSFFAKLF